MGKGDIWKLCRGACGSCGLRMLFWSKDEAIVKCPKCGSEHEVERGEALNLSSGKKSEVALLVLVATGKMGGGEREANRN
jgi:predicted RNA-binding Zn-ribbon protein involved in translation (DUF1610 family)